MADRKEVTIRQHEAVRVPVGWTEQDKALIIQLNRIFDDIYKHYGRLEIEDLGQALKDLLQAMRDDIDENAGDIDDLVEDVGALQEDMTTAQGDIGDLQGDVSDLQGDMTTAQGNITDLQGDMTTAKGNITDLQTDVGSLKTNAVTNVAWDSNKLKKTQNGTTTDVMNGHDIMWALPAFTWGHIKGQHPIPN